MMKKEWRIPALLSLIILILAGVLIGLLIFMRNQPMQVRGVQPQVEVKPLEPDSSIWGQNFPNQYSTLLLTETNTAKTTYGGSEALQKLEVDPRLVKLFAGNPFSIDYKEDRGHLNSVSDVQNTQRINDKTPGTCYSCK